MKIHFKKKMLFLASIGVLLVGCITNENTSSERFITDAQRVHIREFATENGYPSTMALDSFIRYEFYDWPYDAEIKDFFLTFPKQDTTPRTLVLSDVLTRIGKSLRVYYEPFPYGGAISSATIDSIEIKTDSVIIMPGLNLSYCNLTHLPPEIGKVRVRALDFSNNENLTCLPIEITQMDSTPQPYDSLDVNFDGVWSTQEIFDTLPDWAKEWLGKHNL